jgi:hypothetical protein
VFWCLLQISEFNPAEYDRSHPNAFERTLDHPTRLRLTTVKQTHERTSGGRSNASARRSNAVANERTPAAIERRAAVSS